MPYNPYLHAHELGLKLRWADDVDPIEAARWEPMSSELVLRTGMNAIHERCALALHVVYAERGALGDSAAIGLHYHAARRLAATRLIDRDSYKRLMRHAQSCELEAGKSLREQWVHLARYLGVTTGFLDAFAEDNPPLIDKRGETINEPRRVTLDLAVPCARPIVPIHPTTAPVTVIPATGDTGEILRSDLLRTVTEAGVGPMGLAPTDGERHGMGSEAALR